MRRCAATKRDGTRCTLFANGPQGLCWAHSPANAERRSRMAAKAARSKPNKELRTLKGELKVLISDVLSGAQDRGRAAVAIQAYGALTRLLEAERRAREQDELEGRIASLEEQQAKAKTTHKRRTW